MTSTLTPHRLPLCPHLPLLSNDLDYRHLAGHGEARGGAFYLSCLEYGHVLWQRGLAARAVLCLDRALGAAVSGDEPELRAWPLPYAAMAWFLVHTPPDVFIGNPRVHFQHYADRMNAPRREQRAARAWACWALTRRLRPEWPADPRHKVTEPAENQLTDALNTWGIPGETALWQAVLDGCTPGTFSPRKDFGKKDEIALDRRCPDSSVHLSSPSRGGSSAG